MNSIDLVGPASALVSAMGLYLLLGALFALFFLFRGLSCIDPLARGGTWGFRLLVFPGVVLFWPWLAYRWWRGTSPPEEWNAHRRQARRDGGA